MIKKLLAWSLYLRFYKIYEASKAVLLSHTTLNNSPLLCVETSKHIIGYSRTLLLKWSNTAVKPQQRSCQFLAGKRITKSCHPVVGGFRGSYTYGAKVSTIGYYIQPTGKNKSRIFKCHLSDTVCCKSYEGRFSASNADATPSWNEPMFAL